jgi:asparagine synthase (glutamine-hydrolysing)
MREASRHRGPDDVGVYLDGNVGLGFNRLSIIDLSGGHQPMSNEDGTVWIVFNGEIYNFGELRDTLLSKGHRFETRSDTETIVHAWEEYGENCVERLRGMFAFVIWDSRRRVLFGARDRIGIKPFYYYADNDVFAFASELKSLLEVQDIPRRLDLASLEQYLRHRYVIAPHTVLDRVCKLPPAHWIKVDQSGISVQRYWNLPLTEPRRIGLKDALEEFDALIQETMRQHLVADVPLGAFLSGGLDSSAVVALMAKLGVADIKTFSIGYNSPESELPFARVVAEHFRTDHHELVLDPEKFQEFLPRIIGYMDEPVADEAALPLYFVSQLARQRVTVALSGEGSDEIFSGYPMYHVMLALEQINRIPLAGFTGKVIETTAGEGKLRKYARMLGVPLEARYGGVSTGLSREQISRLMVERSGEDRDALSVGEAYRESRGLPVLSRMSCVDLKTWLPSNLLVKADRMSMANSLELRVPFLDHKVVEFAFTLPPELKIHRRYRKYLLRKYMDPMLPAEIIHRPKRGFPVPTSGWFRGSLADFARETLRAAGSLSDSVFSRSEIEQILKLHQHQDQSAQIYSLLVAELWQRTYLHPSAAATPLASASR